MFQFPGDLLPAGEPIAQHWQVRLPVLLLLLHPRIKGGFFAQPEAVEEGAAHQRKGVLDLGDEGSALRLSGDGGEPLDLFPGLRTTSKASSNGACGFRPRASC